MKKSRNITKYEPRWQLLRAQVKGKKTPLRSKLEQARAFYDENPTKANWERVANWMEGLRIVYNKRPDSPEYQLIDEFLQDMQVEIPTAEERTEDPEEVLMQAPCSALITLWEDLYTRNEKWTKNGYLHAEHNAFTALLATVLTQKQCWSQTKHSLADWKKQIETAKSRPNTHKFFF